MLVEPALELKERLPKFLDSVEGPHPQQLFLQGPDEPLGHAVALRGLDEAGTRLDAEKGNLLLEGMAHVLRTMVVPQDQALGDVLSQWPVVFPKPLVNRLQRFKARSGAGGMDTDHIADEVVDGHEHRGRALQPGLNLSRVGTPYPVRAIRDDGAAVALAEDDRAQVAAWLDSQLLHRASEDEARTWAGENPLFWAVVVAPWVVIQIVVPD